ncbi:twin-arginine translocase TatA/TatE family subunit, partial [Priestia megaterium]|uniref:twin-arginine translocase TatA/TatE family subunit n=1 Tax=Priestia megaterium TaxID=1404 RepID=UPI002E25FE4B
VNSVTQTTSTILSNIPIPPLLIIFLIPLIIFPPSNLPQLPPPFAPTLTQFKPPAKALLSDDQSVKQKQAATLS